ncbi:oxidoreductase [Streptomyces albus]|uniref:Oxidoreductase n=1 Tax=Streptomyces albus (strain ATCC 21838 / DSM 41398 / FERM P-419 / JCM 4703 / NBRC 107858) TaxID=1081613 RepID=A0A0B5ETA8_STRA4|nr:oxidoreductase [Streptomyces albus]AOU80369.1 oxidoreductase [Streptomyces albus]AYN36081.1 oxidoreductase [Streptomyces albus]
MREPSDRADVVIVGAGIAGLSAAHRLTSAGLRVRVLEAAPEVGGRMSTELLDGFRLDRLGQLLCASYPELHRNPALAELVLRPFAPGVLLHSGGRHHRAGDFAGVRGGRGALSTARALAPRVPRPRLPGSAFSPAGGPLGQARLGAALARLAATGVPELLARPEAPAAEALRARGLPPKTVEGFVRPLLAALLGDPDLGTSSRAADLALYAFARGPLCLPEGGAAELPRLLAAALPPGTVRTSVRVTSVSADRVGTAEHGRLRCRGVLVATGARSAAALLPGLRTPGFHPLTVVHHTAETAPPTGPALLLDADRRGPVAHTAVVSEVDPSRAPAGRPLISSTVLGTPPDRTAKGLDAAVRRHLALLYGTSTARWELLAVHHTPDAVPAMPPPHDLRRAVRLLAGLYVCGDHRDTSTVQGALHSGRRAARAILGDLGVRPVAAEEPVPAIA